MSLIFLVTIVRAMQMIFPKKGLKISRLRWFIASGNVNFATTSILDDKGT